MNSQTSFLEIKFSRPDRVYRPNEKVSGSIIVNAKDGWAHRGIDMKAEGVVHLSFARPDKTGNFGIDENTTKTIVIFNHSFQAVPSGKCKEGFNEYPFEFLLLNQDISNNLLESYHGVYISVVYSIQISCDRGMMKKSLHCEAEYVVEIPSNRYLQQPIEKSPILFDFTSETLESITPSMRQVLPQFHFIWKFCSSVFPIQSPLTGEIIVKFIAATSSLRSVELQLVRIETIRASSVTDSSNNSGSNNTNVIKEVSEIQNIQIIDGNVCRDLAIPIYMIFPRLYTCPTISSNSFLFKVEFELNLIIVFAEGYSVTKNFPIVIIRS